MGEKSIFFCHVKLIFQKGKTIRMTVRLYTKLPSDFF